MSAIGDYVHYRAKNYNKYGITQNTPSSAEYNFAMQKNKIMTKVKAFHSAMTEAEKKQMQENLRYLLSTKINDDNINKAVKEVQDYVYQELKERFKNSLGDINFNTGDVTFEQIVSKRDNKLTTLQIKNTAKVTNLTTILNKVKQIQADIPLITSATKRHEVQQQIKAIYRKLSSLTGVLQKGLKSNTYTAATRRSDASSISKSINVDLSTQVGQENRATLIEDINKIIRVMGATPPVALEKGELFEYLIALAPYIAKVRAGKEFEQTFSELVASSKKGDVASKTSISSDFFYSNVIEKIGQLGIQKWQFDKVANSFISMLASQEKIDVQVELGDGSPGKISAKNVSFASGSVHILSGSSLLYLIQDSDTDFINHYLNLAAEHPDAEAIDTRQLYAAREAMKITLFAKALSGKTFGREAAELFIVNNNDSSNEDIRVYEISGLIDAAAKNINSIAKITQKDSDGDIDTLTFKNAWSNVDYLDRLTKLLADVHSKKINAAINISALR